MSYLCNVKKTHPIQSARRTGKFSPPEAQKHTGASSEDLARPVREGERPPVHPYRKGRE